MKNRNIFFLTILSLLIIGCGRWVDVKISDVKTDDYKCYLKSYKVGEIKTVFIGQEIIKISPFTKTTSYYAIVPKNFIIETRYKFRNYKIEPGSREHHPITKSVIIEGRKYYIISLKDNHDYIWGILLDINGVIYESALYSFNHEMLYYPDSSYMSHREFKISKIDNAQSNDELPFELIYSGKNNVSLNVIYREFTANDLARPAFFQNLTYEANAKQIRFKNFVIQVHESSNEKLTYTVLEDGLN